MFKHNLFGKTFNFLFILKQNKKMCMLNKNKAQSLFTFIKAQDWLISRKLMQNNKIC